MFFNQEPIFHLWLENKVIIVDITLSFTIRGHDKRKIS